MMQLFVGIHVLHTRRVALSRRRSVLIVGEREIEYRKKKGMLWTNELAGALPRNQGILSSQTKRQYPSRLLAYD